MEERFKALVRATYLQTKTMDEFVLSVVKTTLSAWKEAEAEFGALPNMEEELDALIDPPTERLDPDEEIIEEIMQKRVA